MRYFDAHNHLHDKRLLGLSREELWGELSRLPLEACVVNATEPEDWQAVAELVGQAPFRVIPAYGVHPWKVSKARGSWLENLEERLVGSPAATVGEVGLDGWIEAANIPLQLSVLEPQVRLAVELGRVLTFHCLRAWGPFMNFLKDQELPKQGFLVHSPGASTEIIEQLAEYGAYFSVSGALCDPRKAKYQRALQAIPLDRLLIETDAPDMLAPEPWREHCLVDPLSGERVTHPADLVSVYRYVAEERGLKEEALSAQLAENFEQLFGR